MGAFNVLNVVAACQNCGNLVNTRYQFKYGECWQHEYRIGDELKWGGNQKGKPSEGLIAMDACGEECPICDWAEDQAVIFVERNRIVGVGPNRGKYDFSRSYDVIELRPPRPLFYVINLSSKESKE